VRKAYGLSRSRALLTSPDLESETSHMLSALKLCPQFESALGPEIAQ
jgi:hypothetical protein